MLNENAKKWVAALRSGKYTQTTARLTKIGKDGEVVGHCCLGVACEVAMENGVDLRVEDDTQNSGRRYDDDIHYLPTKVQEWLGLETHSGRFFEDGTLKGTLAEYNDRGIKFAKIADIIEHKFPGLFVE